MSAVLKVAVSQRVDVWADRGERRDALDQRLYQWLVAAGCLPVPVPNTLGTPLMAGHDEALQAWLHAMQPDAIVLSGGNDIGAAPERDHTERCLLAYGRDKALPALGICRGMQMMAVWAGGSLVPVSGHVRTRHRLAATASVGVWPDEVNSSHHFALAAGPPGYVLTARAEDGTIEAMRHETLPWEGWMWHPEREQPFNPIDATRFRALLDSGRPP
ncbi:MAG: gamma-glutamyl-gamma-aminobutyrate hydrolase family protein [Gallionellaceae bacterium]